MVQIGIFFFRQNFLRTFMPVVCGMALLGCGSVEEPFKKETMALTGQVFVNGDPVPATTPLKIECHNVAGFDKEHPTISSALTAVDGNFEISTYESGDGLPEGTYALTFMWGKMNLISASYDGPDQLKGRYSDAETSEFKVTVKKGEPIEFQVIMLTTDD